MMRVLLLIIFLFTCFAFSAQIEITKDADKIGTEDTLAVTISIEGSDAAPELQTEDFELRGSSRSSQIQVVNGAVSKKTIYQLELAPKKIGKASFVIQLGSESKGPVVTEVVQGKVKPQVAPQSNPFDDIFSGGGWADRAPSQPKPITDEEVIVRNELSKNQVHVHEPLVLNTVLYTRVPLARLGLVKEDNLGTLSSENLKDFDNRDKTVTINGQPYQARIIRSRVIYPTLSGVETIKGGVVRVEGPGNFWRGPVKDIAIPDVKLTTKNFEEGGANKKPLSFNGAVGDFALKVTMTPTTLKAHEPATLRLEITGIGNFHILPIPSLTFSNLNSTLTIKRAAIKPDYKLERNNWTGKIVAEYYIIPDREGTYRLPGIQWTTYSPTRESFVTLNSPDLLLNVLRGDPKETLFPGAKPGTEVLGEDIKFIKTDLAHFPKRNIFLEPLFIFSHALVFTLLLLLSLYHFYHKNFLGSTRQAPLRESLFLLSQAKQTTDPNEFYRLIEEALQAYITKMLKLPPSSSLAEIRNLGSTLDRHPGLHEALGRIKDAQAKRYAPSPSGEKRSDILSETEKLIYLLDESFSSKKKTAP